MSATHRPSNADLHRFLLGALPPEEARRAAAWVETSPDAPPALAGVAADDTLTAAVAGTVSVADPPAPDVEQIVRNVAALLPLPGVDQQTRPTPAPGSQSGATDDWAGPAPTNPVRLGQFRVVRELGRGGMGVVYEAADESLGRRAAVKVLGAKFAADPDARRRFVREARAVADIVSDHIVTVYQVGEDAGAPFLAMEYIEGTTLDVWLRTRPGPLTVKELLWVARDLLAGLAAVHEKGRIHRDVKPANAMLVRATGRLKLLDFGLSRGADGSDLLTRPNDISGTPAYMSPEQARGEPLDARTDLFSAGVVLYRAVAGKSPFERDTQLNTLFAVGREPPPAALTGVPAALSAFVARLMAATPAGRPADAAAALAELRALEAKLLELPPPIPPRTPWRVALAALAAAVLVVGAVVIVVRDKNGKELAQLKVPDAAAKGGAVEVTDPGTGTKTTVPIGPKGARGETAPMPREAQKDKTPGPLGVGSRVRVTVNTFGYSDSSSAAVRENLGRGATGRITEMPEGNTRCRVELDEPPETQVWVLVEKLEAK